MLLQHCLHLVVESRVPHPWTVHACVEEVYYYNIMCSSQTTIMTPPAGILPRENNTVQMSITIVVTREYSAASV